LLYQRYGNPMQLLQQMFQIGELSRFIDELGQIVWQEKADKQRWEFWLHRVHNIEFNEFVKMCEAQSQEPETADPNKIETIINSSEDILQSLTLRK